MEIEITFKRYPMGRKAYQAQITGDEDKWSLGDSKIEAIGALVNLYPELFNTTIIEGPVDFGHKTVENFDT